MGDFTILLQCHFQLRDLLKLDIKKKMFLLGWNNHEVSIVQFSSFVHITILSCAFCMLWKLGL